MVQIKILTVESIEKSPLIPYNEFIAGLNNFLGYSVDIVSEVDSDFEGYYLIPVGTKYYLIEKYVNEKTFLLCVINRSIDKCLVSASPAGFTDSQLFGARKATVIGRCDVILSNGYEDDDLLILNNNNYGYFLPEKSDGTYETVARSILKYLEMYDKYMKNRKVQ